MTAEQKRVAERLTSLFENGTIEIRYDYAENLHDGRGITCGRAGFCTGTGDAYLAVKRFTEIEPANPLAKYLDELTRLNTAEDSDDVRGLRGFMSDWRAAAASEAFRAVQDEVTDLLYWEPSQRHADDLGLETPLARAFMFDTNIQHGDDGDPDCLTSLLMIANAEMGGTPRTGVNERAWLIAFINARRGCLSYCFNEASRAEWSGSTGRCDTFLSIADSANYDLITPFIAEWNGKQYEIP